jgi:hypothetical protein
MRLANETIMPTAQAVTRQGRVENTTFKEQRRAQKEVARSRTPAVSPEKPQNVRLKPSPDTRRPSTLSQPKPDACYKAWPFPGSPQRVAGRMSLADGVSAWIFVPDRMLPFCFWWPTIAVSEDRTWTVNSSTREWAFCKTVSIAVLALRAQPVARVVSRSSLSETIPC